MSVQENEPQSSAAAWYAAGKRAGEQATAGRRALAEAHERREIARLCGVTTHTATGLEFARHTESHIDRARGGEHVLLTHHGRDQVAMISVAELERLRADQRLLEWMQLRDAAAADVKGDGE